MTRYAALLVLFAIACKNGNDADPRAVDLAKRTTEKYAFEAYPSWSAQHPEKMCPASIAELREYMSGDEKDPWGHPYKMMCGQDLPAGAKGLAVMSLGPDGKDGTADDIKSW
jgi:hypothetical protein